LIEPTDLLNMLDRLGASLVDTSVDPPALAYNSQDVIEAVRWYTDLTTEHAVKPILMTDILGTNTSAIQEWQTILITGRAAMWSKSALIGGLGLASTADYESGVIPLPRGPNGGHGSGYLNVSGYFISSSTEARQACWQWISFLTEQPTIGLGLPARISVAQSEAYRQHVGAETAAAYLASMEGVTQPPFSHQFSDKHSWIGFANIWLYRAYDDIIAKGHSVEEALDSAQEMADAYRACIIANDVANDEAGQQACAQETDPSLPAILFGSAD
jgi:ABC-type glycerol-3-phosphate transport system substrate-binding protein